MMVFIGSRVRLWRMRSPERMCTMLIVIGGLVVIEGDGKEEGVRK